MLLLDIKNFLSPNATTVEEVRIQERKLRSNCQQNLINLVCKRTSFGLKLVKGLRKNKDKVRCHQM